MKLTLAGAFVEAGALWRHERYLLLRLASVFLFLPLLGIVLLLASADFGKGIELEQFEAALLAFQKANIVPVLLASVALDFGTFALLNLFLQGDGRTLGEVLVMTLRRFLPFLAISIVASTLFSLGLSLFLVPGLFIFARTWLAGPAYAAAPEQGPIAAFREGWRRSGGVTWLLILAAAALVMIPALFVIILAAGLISAIGSALDAGQVTAVAGHLVIAAIGALLWAWFAVMRVAFYRLGGASNGI